jgi:hypothetical protein
MLCFLCFFGFKMAELLSRAEAPLRILAIPRGIQQRMVVRSTGSTWTRLPRCGTYTAYEDCVAICLPHRRNTGTGAGADTGTGTGADTGTGTGAGTPLSLTVTLMVVLVPFWMEESPYFLMLSDPVEPATQDCVFDDDPRLVCLGILESLLTDTGSVDTARMFRLDQTTYIIEVPDRNAFRTVHLLSERDLVWVQTHERLWTSAIVDEWLKSLDQDEY